MKPSRFRALYAASAILLLAGLASAMDLRVSTDFEGGSARVESIDQAARVIRFMPGGDPGRGLHVREAASPAPTAIWIQARQHAWESGASWVARGLLEWLLSEDADAIWLRHHAEVFVVPIMDVDNAATGNGGKEADPRDHN